jgi:hypothetical protein
VVVATAASDANQNRHHPTGGITIKIAVVNNGSGDGAPVAGAVRAAPLPGTRSRPRLRQLAEAYGAIGITVIHADDVNDAIATAYDRRRRGDDFRVEREVNVFPMVPQGKSTASRSRINPRPRAVTVFRLPVFVFPEVSSAAHPDRRHARPSAS